MAIVRPAPRVCVAPQLLPLQAMSEAPAPEPLPPPPAPVHQFTVQRGMSIVLVIETTSWYSGLLQAALARITLEGEN